jgi:hypothetical protein
MISAEEEISEPHSPSIPIDTIQEEDENQSVQGDPPIAETLISKPEERIVEREYLDWIEKQEHEFQKKLNSFIKSLNTELLDKGLVPESYHKTTEEEERAFNFVRKYHREYNVIYSQRKDLFLSAKNEYGIEVFIKRGNLLIYQIETTTYIHQKH